MDEGQHQQQQAVDPDPHEGAYFQDDEGRMFYFTNQEIEEAQNLTPGHFPHFEPVGVDGGLPSFRNVSSQPLFGYGPSPSPEAPSGYEIATAPAMWDPQMMAMYGGGAPHPAMLAWAAQAYGYPPPGYGYMPDPSYYGQHPYWPGGAPGQEMGTAASHATQARSEGAALPIAWQEAEAKIQQTAWQAAQIQQAAWQASQGQSEASALPLAWQAAQLEAMQGQAAWQAEQAQVRSEAPVPPITWDQEGAWQKAQEAAWSAGQGHAAELLESEDDVTSPEETSIATAPPQQSSLVAALPPSIVQESRSRHPSMLPPNPQPFLSMTFHKLEGTPKPFSEWNHCEFVLDVLFVSQGLHNLPLNSAKRLPRPLASLGPFLSTAGETRQTVDCLLKDENFHTPLPGSFQDLAQAAQAKGAGVIVAIYEKDVFSRQLVGCALLPLTHFLDHKNVEGGEVSLDTLDPTVKLVRCYNVIRTEDSRITEEPTIGLAGKLYVSIKMAVQTYEDLQRKTRGKKGDYLEEKFRPVGLLQSERERRQTKKQSGVFGLFCSAV